MHPLDIADRDEKKTIAYWRSILEKEGLPTGEEEIFIAASCREKGIAFLKGEGPLMVRKKTETSNEGAKAEPVSRQFRDRRTVVS
jgi:pyruvate carboxylase subunit B